MSRTPRVLRHMDLYDKLKTSGKSISHNALRAQLFSECARVASIRPQVQPLIPLKATTAWVFSFNKRQTSKHLHVVLSSKETQFLAQLFQSTIMLNLFCPLYYERLYSYSFITVVVVCR